MPETPAFRDAESLVAIRGYLRAGAAGRRKLAGAATAMLVHHPANLYLTHMAGQRGGAPAADLLLAAGFTDPSLNAFTLEAIAHSGPGGNSRGDWLADLAGFARWQGNPGLAGQIAALPGATPLSAEAPRVPLLSRNADWAGLLGWLRAGKGEGMTVLSPPPLSLFGGGTAAKGSVRKLLASDLAHKHWHAEWFYGKSNAFFFAGGGKNALHLIGLPGGGAPADGYLATQAPFPNESSSVLLALRYHTGSSRAKLAVHFQGSYSAHVTLPPTGGGWHWIVFATRVDPAREVRPIVWYLGSGHLGLRELVVLGWDAPPPAVGDLSPGWGVWSLSDSTWPRDSLPGGG